jgi:hypothetical protein
MRWDDMSDDLINSVLFYFLCATLDVFATIVVLFLGIGVEGNPVWNWITPKETMLVVCVMANLVFCVFVIFAIPYLKRRHLIYQKVVKFGLIGEGLGRVAFGAIPGILLMNGAGWF